MQLDAKMADLRDLWEETSCVLNRRQTSALCAESEQKVMKQRSPPQYTLNFDPDEIPQVHRPLGKKSLKHYVIQFFKTFKSEINVRQKSKIK